MTKAFLMRLTPEADALVEQIAVQLGTTKIGVMRYGLSALNALLRAEVEGGNLAIVKQDKVLKVLVPLWPAA